MDDMNSLVPVPKIDSFGVHEKKIRYGAYALASFIGILIFAHYLQDIQDFVDGLVSLTEALITLAVLIGGFFFSAYVLKKFSKAIIILIDNWSLRAKIAAIRADPFGTAQNAIDQSRLKLKTMTIHIQNLRGSLERLKDKITKFLKSNIEKLNEAEIADQKMRAEKPNSSNWKTYKRMKETCVRMAANFKDSAERLKPNMKRASELYEFLNEFFQMATADIDEAQQNLDLQIEVFDINRDSVEAERAALAAMSGDQKEMLDTAMFEANNKIFAMMGEIDHVMDMTRPLLEAKRFDDEVSLKLAMDEFDKWMNEDTNVSAEQKQQLMLKAGSTENLIDADLFTNTSDEDAIPVPTARSKYDVR